MSQFNLNVLIALAFIVLGLPFQTSAQTQSYPETVFLDQNSNLERVAFPSQTLAFTVQGVSSFTAPLLEVRVPAGLRVEEGHTCSAHALLDPVGGANQNARRSEVLCSGGLSQEVDGSWVFRISTGDSYQPVLTYNVFLEFSVTVPPETEPGMLFAITAPTASLSEEMVSINIEVLNPDGSHADRLMTPTPPVISQITPPINDTPLMLMPDVVEAQPGEIVTIDFHIPRSATWELESFAFLAWAEKSTINNVQSSFLDASGEAACSVGNDNDEVSALERAAAIGEGALLPRSLIIQVGDDVQPGQRLQVCVELVGFAGTNELYSWNVYAVIAIVGG